MSDPWEMLRSSRDILVKNGVAEATDETGQYTGFVATVNDEIYRQLVDVTNHAMRSVRLQRGYHMYGDDVQRVMVDGWYFEKERTFVVRSGHEL